MFGLHTQIKFAASFNAIDLEDGVNRKENLGRFVRFLPVRQKSFNFTPVSCGLCIRDVSCFCGRLPPTSVLICFVRRLASNVCRRDEVELPIQVLLHVSVHRQHWVCFADIMIIVIIVNISNAVPLILYYSFFLMKNIINCMFAIASFHQFPINRG